MQWTDRIRRIKIGLLAVAVVIAAGSLVVSHYLIRDMEREERSKMEVWAEAMNALNKADETTDLSLVLKVLNSNHTIPVIVLDNHGSVLTYRNIEADGDNRRTKNSMLSERGRRLRDEGRYIRLHIDGSDHAFIDVCYDDSLMLRRLALYPYVQLAVVLPFLGVALFALLASKRAEQNRVWVGLSKETAHQLGTPISSLMAWTEILKENYPDDTLIGEMEHDVRRLQLVADRFSKIGSIPEPVPTDLNGLLRNAADYMERRMPAGITVTCHFHTSEIIVPLNASLFEWVVENLCKNAVDAMNGAGRLTLMAEEQAHRVVVEVEDTGRGIRKKDLRNVFRPGFTTKPRGWGLGLSLARRIVEEYHRGRIFVKSSAPGHGTTFRIELRK